LSLFGAGVDDTPTTSRAKRVDMTNFMVVQILFSSNNIVDRSLNVE
jgi:hypothetical protein